MAWLKRPTGNPRTRLPASQFFEKNGFTLPFFHDKFPFWKKIFFFSKKNSAFINFWWFLAIFGQILRKSGIWAEIGVFTEGLHLFSHDLKLAYLLIQSGYHPDEGMQNILNFSNFLKIFKKRAFDGCAHPSSTTQNWLCRSKTMFCPFWAKPGFWPAKPILSCTAWVCTPIISPFFSNFQKVWKI